MPEPTPLEPDRALLGRAVVGAALILGAAGLAGWLLRAPIHAAGGWFVQELGLTGLALAVIVMDSCLLPLANEPLLLLAVAGGVSPWTTFGVAASASTFAGLVGYSFGAALRRGTRLAGRFQGRFPGAARFLTRYGAWGVALAAVTPLPFSVSTWSAGMMGVPVWKVAAASTLRVPKTGFYLWLMLQGWALGGA